MTKENLIILDVKNFSEEDVYNTINNISPLLKKCHFIISDLNKKRVYKKNFLTNYKIENKNIKDIILTYDFKNINNVLVLEVNDFYNIEELNFLLKGTYENNTLYSFNLVKGKYKEIYDVFNKSFDLFIFNGNFQKLNKIKNELNSNLIINNYSHKLDVSILIPVYNAEKDIKRCLESCINQNFNGTYEIIIIDDGSTDKTVNVINNFDNSKIKLFQREHLGISKALNYGLTKCNGKYICRMDSDDIMYSNRLNYQFNYMENNECDILCNNVNRYLKKDNKLTPYKHSFNLELIKNNITLEDLFDVKNNYNFLCHSSIFFNKELYNNIFSKENKFYDSEYDLAEDYELYCRLIKNYNIRIRTDNVILLDYTVKENNKEKLIKITKLRNILYEKYNDNFSKLTIGIYYIATGIYKNDFKRFLLSVKNFFPNNKKKIVLLSDGLNEYNNYFDEKNNIEIIVKYIIDFPWPINTLFKMKYIYDNIVDTDYVFYFNANAEILPIKTYSWFDKDNIVFTYHKDWFNNNCNSAVFCEPYMDNPNSTSYIGTTNYTYIQGAFFGGPTNKIYEMCKCINEMITIDLQNNIIPRYHDETYLNKYNFLCKDNFICNLLISEIVYNKNDLNNIEDTQFIILNENVYNKKQNNKASKFDFIINHNQLKPLYNYDNIYDYISKYPSYYNENKYNGKDVILIFIQENRYINDIIEKVKVLKKKYELICFNDSRLDKDSLKKLYSIFDSKHIYGFDILTLLALKENINNLYYEAEQLSNLIFRNDYWFNIINEFNFKNLYIINDIKSFIDNDNILTCDKQEELLLNNYDICNILDFNSNYYTKKYNLFQYRYKYKYQIFSDLLNYRISHNAFEFLYKFKDPIKLTIPQYYIPSLLFNNGYSLEKY